MTARPGLAESSRRSEGALRMGFDPGNRNWCDYWASEGCFVTNFGMTRAQAAVSRREC